MQVSFNTKITIYSYSGHVVGKLDVSDEPGVFKFTSEFGQVFTQDELHAIAEKLRELNGEKGE